MGLWNEDGMKSLIGKLVSLLPLLIIVALLYAALFVKPRVEAANLVAPVIERRDQFFGVAVADAQIIWAVGSDGKIVRSADRGKSWSAQRSGSTSVFQSIAAWDAQRAVAVGNAGIVTVTTDGGSTWAKAKVPQELGQTKLTRVRASTDGNAWAVGEMGAVLRSTDHGATWERVHVLATEKDITWNDVGFDGSKGCVVGEFGQIVCTADNGQTWSASSSPVKSSLMAVRFASRDRAIVVGLEGVVLHTRNAGASWTRIATDTHEHLFDVLCDGEGWGAVGAKGVLVMSDGRGEHPKTAQIPDMRMTWFTAIEKLGNGYVLAGSLLGLVEGTKVTRLGDRI